VTPGLALCFLIVGVVVVMAILRSAIAPHQAGAQNLADVLGHPSGAHWLGTDALGRDVFSRIIVGARTAIIGPLVIAGGSMILGNMLGLFAGYRGGKVDGTIMRWVDLMWSVPAIIVIIVVEGAVGGGYWLAVALLLVLTVPFDTRVVRGATLEQAPRPYVEAAKTTGTSDLRIMFLHVWPNVAPVAVANTFLIFAGSVTAIAGLSFLGLGVPPGTADWGVMLSEGLQDLFVNPIAVLAPGVLIVLTVTSMNLIGDWLYEWLSSRGAER
jgi:peptide/nickel transport system permease protein